MGIEHLSQQEADPKADLERVVAEFMAHVSRLDTLLTTRDGDIPPEAQEKHDALGRKIEELHGAF